MRKYEDTVRVPGASPIRHNAARNTSAVLRDAPVTKQSASPRRTRAAAWNSGSAASASTSDGGIRSPRATRSAWTVRSCSAGDSGSISSTLASCTSCLRAVARDTSGVPMSCTLASPSRPSRSAAFTIRSSEGSARASRWMRARAARRSRSISPLIERLPHAMGVMGAWRPGPSSLGPPRASPGTRRAAS